MFKRDISVIKLREFLALENEHGRDVKQNLLIHCTDSNIETFSVLIFSFKRKTSDRHHRVWNCLLSNCTVSFFLLIFPSWNCFSFAFYFLVIVKLLTLCVRRYFRKMSFCLRDFLSKVNFQLQFMGTTMMLVKVWPTTFKKI